MITRDAGPGLRADCLPFGDVFAQSIATIAPTVGPALTISLVYADAGVGTWLTYLIATIGMLFVGGSINVFARCTASPGSLSDFIRQGLGAGAGVVAGWAMAIAYLFTAMAVASAFANFMDVLLAPAGLPAPALGWIVACVVLAWYFAHRDIRLSTALMLALEVASIALILLLAILVLFTKGTFVDPAQLSLAAARPSGILFGLVLATLSFVGFESATTLGHEARDPLRTIPRAVTLSTLCSGLFYVLMTYVLVLGFSSLPIAMNRSHAPLSDLSAYAGVGWLGVLISIGTAVSMFACTLACINAAARVLYTMAGQAAFHPAASRTHDRNATPHVAAAIAACLVGITTAAVSAAGIGPLDAFAYFGTIGTYGFLTAYMLVAIAAPCHLRRRGGLRPTDVLTSVAAVAMMALPVVASIGIPVEGSLLPVPPAPYNLFPYLFAVTLAGATAWSLAGQSAARSVGR